MMRHRRLFLFFLAFGLLPSAIFGADRNFKNGEAVIIEPDKAYLMARTFEVKGRQLAGTIHIAPILIRVQSEEELRQAEEARKNDPKTWKDKMESNVSEMLAAEPYALANGELTLLTAVKPGTYVLAGVAGTNWATKDIGMLNVSLCMGTVKFEAKAGAITDLGEILTAYDDTPTTIPELANLVSGKETSLGGTFGPYAYVVAVRPSNAAASVPAQLGNLLRAAADYRAMPAHPNFLGASLSRLAPVQGVLDYDKNGEVVDLKTAGSPAEAKAGTNQTEAKQDRTEN